jgi:UDP-N-acetylglucosamine 2-epimerase (non-hydrolysing)
MDPVGFFEFVALQKQALAVLTDSGTVQEECAILGIPAVTLRDVTERPETVECGANVLAGSEPLRIAALTQQVVSGARGWPVPPEYLRANVTDTVCRIVTGYHHGFGASTP